MPDVSSQQSRGAEPSLCIRGKPGAGRGTEPLEVRSVETGYRTYQRFD